MSEQAEKVIKITGAAEHNLKNIDVQIPRNAATLAEECT